MTTLKLTGTLLAANPGEPLRYRLLTYGEPGNTSAGRVTAAAGSITVPEDVATLEPVNLEHDRIRPVGRFVELTETPEGLEAAVSTLDTTAGRDARLEATEGVRAGISVELDKVVIRAGKLLAGVLTGAGLVVKPAFPSSMLTAADAGVLDDDQDDDEDEDTDDEDTDEDTDDEVVDEHHAETTDTYTNPDGSTVTTETTTDSTTTISATSEEDNMGNTTVKGAAAGATRVNATDREERPAFGLEQLTAALDSMEDLRGEGRLNAALSPITQTSIYDKTAVPEYVGELWEGRSPVERYAGLVKDNGPLTAAVSKGWRFAQGPEVHPYAGNLADVTSTPVSVEPEEIKADRLAGGNRLDRIYTDLPDAGFWDSYLRHSAQDYAIKRDERIGYHIMTNATVTQYDEATEVPAFYNGSVGWAMLARAARLTLRKVVPDFAIVGADLWEEMVLTQRDDALEFLSAQMGLDDSGSLAGFRIIGASEDPLVGADGTTFDMTGKVLAGTSQTTLKQELPGGPIRVNAEVIDKGGVDHGVFGYIKLWTPTAYNVLVEPAPAV